MIAKLVFLSATLIAGAGANAACYLEDATSSPVNVQKMALGTGDKAEVLLGTIGTVTAQAFIYDSHLTTFTLVESTTGATATTSSSDTSNLDTNILTLKVGGKVFLLSCNGSI